MIPIVINADDFGLSDGVCRSVAELFEVGAISNTTIMAGVPGALDRVRQYSSLLRGKAGVHLHISYGSPLSPVYEVPSLADQQTGLFKGMKYFDFVDFDELRVEFKRQIDAVIGLLGGITHIDTHHTVHPRQGYEDVYFELARQYNVPVRGYDLDYYKKIKAAGLNGSAMIEVDWTGQEQSVDVLKTYLQNAAKKLGNGQVLEAIVHPAYNDAHLEIMSTWNRNREADHAGLLQLGQENWLAQNGFKLVSFPSLA